MGEAAPVRYHYRRYNEKDRGERKSFQYCPGQKQSCAPTLASNSVFIRYEPYYISERDIILMQSFPLDYDFMDANKQYCLWNERPTYHDEEDCGTDLFAMAKNCIELLFFK
ncbi:hypothetical protein KOF112_28730 [Bacillus velezensis]|nr:hypothetical protein KOF112_28730 [Bacillus velezensis]